LIYTDQSEFQCSNKEEHTINPVIFISWDYVWIVNKKEGKKIYQSYSSTVEWIFFPPRPIINSATETINNIIKVLTEGKDTAATHAKKKHVVVVTVE
jgi:hypothetical protein